MKRKILLVVLILPIIFFFGCNRTVKLFDNVILQGKPATKNSKVILQFTTQLQQLGFASQMVNSMALSQFFLYDESGKLKTEFSLNSETTSGISQQIDGGIVFFFPNYSFYISESSYECYSNPIIDTKNSIRFGPDITGWLSDLNYAYAVFNVGSDSLLGYKTILRIANSFESYDVVISYPIQSINYDEINKRFVYEIRSIALNQDNALGFGFIEFNDKTLRFENFSNLTIVDTKVIQDFYGEGAYSKFCVRDQTLYRIDARSINENISRTLGFPNEYNENFAILTLETIDLTTGEISCEVVSEPYPKSSTGNHAFLVGHRDLPAVCCAEKIYVFTSAMEVYVFSPDTGFIHCSTNFNFDNVKGCSNLFGEETICDFSDSLLKVANNGDIYLCNVYNDDKIRVHKLNMETGLFELFWESHEKIPKLEHERMELISFHILT